MHSRSVNGPWWGVGSAAELRGLLPFIHNLSFTLRDSLSRLPFFMPSHPQPLPIHILGFCPQVPVGKGLIYDLVEQCLVALNFRAA